MRSAVNVALIYSLFAVPDSVSAQEISIPLIQEGSLNSRASIRSIHARYEIKQEVVFKHPNLPKSRPLISKVEWWQDGNSIRWVEETTTYFSKDQLAAKGSHRSKDENEVTQIECVASNGEMTVITRKRRTDGSTEKSAQRNFHKAEHPLRNDLWSLSLFDLLSTPRKNLSELLKLPGAVKSAETRLIGRRRYYRLIVSAPPPQGNYEYEILIDPNCNFLVKSFTPRESNRTVNTTARFEKEALSFREYESGIYFPHELETRLYLINQVEPKTEHLWKVSRVRFHSIEINKPINPKIFQLVPKDGTPVVDYRDKSSYLAGPNGMPRGEVGPAPESAPTPTVPTYKEGPRFNWVLSGVIITSILALLILTVLVMRRRRTSA